jgi:hypothetical protein
MATIAKLWPAAKNIAHFYFLVCNILYLGQRILHTRKFGECNSIDIFYISTL